MKRFVLVLKILILIFALIGFFFTVVFVGMQFGWFNVRGSIIERNKFFTDTGFSPLDPGQVFSWEQTPEWGVLSVALSKDTSVIQNVAKLTDVPARLIVSVVVPEQIRFFTSNRESYKKYFEPLKILGILSQFSLGVSGMKPETALQIEKNNVDTNSQFYPGDKYKNLLDYPADASHDTALYDRLTDPHDRYYQYLYTALFIKQIMNQWRVAGFDLTDKPEVITTLFNLGFVRSTPNSSPEVGGAPVEIGGKVLSFGELGAEFYYSSQLLDKFPR